MAYNWLLLVTFSYYDVMNGTFINGLRILFTIYLKIMTSILFDNTINATYSSLTSYTLVCRRGIPFYL